LVPWVVLDDGAAGESLSLNLRMSFEAGVAGDGWGGEGGVRTYQYDDIPRGQLPLELRSFGAPPEYEQVMRSPPSIQPGSSVQLAVGSPSALSLASSLPPSLPPSLPFSIFPSLPLPLLHCPPIITDCPGGAWRATTETWMSGTEMDFLSEGVSGGAAGGGDDGPLTTSGHELTTSGHGRHGPHAGFAGRGRREGGDATTCVLLRDGGAAKVPEEAHGEGEGQKDAPTDTQTHTHTHTHEDDEVTMKLYEYAEVHMKIAPTEFKVSSSTYDLTCILLLI